MSISRPTPNSQKDDCGRNALIIDASGFISSIFGTHQRGSNGQILSRLVRGNGVSELPATPADVARYVRYLFDWPRRTFYESYERGGKTVIRAVSHLLSATGPLTNRLPRT